MTDERATEILKSLTSSMSDEGVLLNEAIGLFRGGRRLEELRRLLGSGDQETVRRAIWITSELGSVARPLLAQVAALLTAPERRTRFFAIDSVLSCAGSEDGDVVARVADCLEDSDAAVRWKAMQFFAQASESQLHAAIESMTSSGAAASRLEGLRWIEVAASKGTEVIEASLSSDDALQRKYAVIAAARLAKKDDTPLRRARESSDPDVQRFARDRLALP